eukprot:CAMPEP_0201480202 /NCGR_PEP_ID=MMETSP0151_2-20130828/4732_1 /ASSEMBLY_ACC=CAM_ASM_000257 /TAXON_ID=200890 /ORGANISM="Paramoeba atlantica, Strain 621/1 / CCAP 1560/9" /LENGTH=182 /DNA_ID=CAMNT_0047861983 /DNA_START=68 /DNA_END=616 /DNA_ORIENTATION=-
MQSWLVVVALFLASVALASADPTANLTSEKHSRGVYKCAYFAGTYSTRVLPSNEGTSDWCTAGVGELVIYPNCRLQIAEFYTLADQTCGHWWRNGVFSYQAGSTYGALRTIAASENSASTNANYDGFNSDRNEVIYFDGPTAESNVYIFDGSDSTDCALNRAYYKVSDSLDNPFDICTKWTW